MTLFRETYRIESARKPYWDYCCPGWYFVTICTKNRRPLFGKVVDDEVDLSAIGGYTAGCWQEVPAHHRNVEIDEFIVMPNHVHGIIVLTGPERMPALRRRGQIKRTAELTSVHPQPGSLGAVVGSFKAAVSYWCRTHNLEFGWQARFHDRIIRGKNSLKAIREYIRENPANWRKDTLFVA
jgi:REP element-mobilizing transposase RayT